MYVYIKEKRGLRKKRQEALATQRKKTFLIQNYGKLLFPCITHIRPVGRVRLCLCVCVCVCACLLL